MELRHLRYFIAVAEEGSLTAAAEKRLFTAQPSLSRQIQALENEVGTQLLIRSGKGVELTAAGKVYLEHARMVLAQIELAGKAARDAATSSKPRFALGFLTGQEMNWLPQAMRALATEMSKIDISVSSQYSPGLANELMSRRLDVAFMRREPNLPELAYQLVASEPLWVILPSDHRLATGKTVSPTALQGQTFINVSSTAPVLRAVIDSYIARNRLAIDIAHEVDNLAMAISLVASTRGVSLLPEYARNFLPWSVTSRPLEGDAPCIDLVLGYRKSNRSPLLELFLPRMADMLAERGKR